MSDVDIAALAQEEARLLAAQSLHIFDTAPEAAFDEAAIMAAAICGTPIALIGLLDRDRQWFKARVGVDAEEVPRTQTFCNDLVGQREPLIVADASVDSRYQSSPMVTGASAIRFYAGMPLNTTEGYTVGTLCVVDTVPHALSSLQIEALKALGRQVTAQLELRGKVRLLDEVAQRKRRIERELRDRTALFAAFMDHSPAIGFIKNEAGQFLYYNKMFCDRFAVSSEEWIGKTDFDLFPEEFATAYHSLDLDVLTSGKPQIVEETSPGPNGATLYWRTHKFAIDRGHEPPLLGGLSMDISSEQDVVFKLQRSQAQLQASNVELKELSMTDGLTGLKNRRAFDERIREEMRQGSQNSLVLLDIDNFKSLNDTFGHPAGDEVLQTVAHLITREVRGLDCVARFGGEEFVVLLVGIGEEEAVTIAERIRKAIARSHWPQRPITLSAGVAAQTDKLCDGSSLVKAADTALYRAKHAGRNRVECFERGSYQVPPAHGARQFDGIPAAGMDEARA